MIGSGNEKGASRRLFLRAANGGYGVGPWCSTAGASSILSPSILRTMV
jgi:hypothetical protein